MSRPFFTLVAWLALVLHVPVSHAQGLYGVTRPTRTLERQAVARQFFDAAGLNVTGGTPGAAPAASPSALVPLAQAPRPNATSGTHPMTPRVAQPLIAGTPARPTPAIPRLNAATNRPVVVSKPLAPPTSSQPRHVPR